MLLTRALRILKCRLKDSFKTQLLHSEFENLDPHSPEYYYKYACPSNAEYDALGAEAYN